MIFLNIGEPDFTAAPAVVEAASRCMAAGLTQYTAATGEPLLREAISRWYAERFGVDVPARRIVVTAGASAALQLACLALVDAGRRGAHARPELPVQPALRRRRGRRAGAAGGAARAALAARRGAGRGGLDAAHRGRAARLAVEPDRHLDRPGRDGAHPRRGARARRLRDRRRDLPRARLRRALRHQRAGARRAARRGAGVDQQLLEVLLHDRLAARLDGGARRPRAGGREAGAEPLHLPLDAGPAGGAGLLRAGVDRRVRAPPRRVPAPARLPGAGPRPARPAGAGAARRRLLRLGRLLGARRVELGLRLRRDARGARRHHPRPRLRPRGDGAPRAHLVRQLDGAPGGGGGAARERCCRERGRSGPAPAPRRRRRSASRCASTGRTPTPAASSSTPTT